VGGVDPGSLMGCVDRAVMGTGTVTAFFLHYTNSRQHRKPGGRGAHGGVASQGPSWEQSMPLVGDPANKGLTQAFASDTKSGSEPRGF